MLILRDSVASRGVIPPTVAAAVAIAMMVVRSDGYDVWYFGYNMNMQILGEFHYESRSLFVNSMVTVELDGSLL